MKKLILFFNLFFINNLNSSECFKPIFDFFCYKDSPLKIVFIDDIHYFVEFLQKIKPALNNNTVQDLTIDFIKRAFKKYGKEKVFNMKFYSNGHLKSLLRLMIEEKFTEVVFFLLQEGAISTIKTEELQDLFLLACKTKNPIMVKLLLKAGADIYQSSQITNLIFEKCNNCKKQKTSKNFKIDHQGRTWLQIPESENRCNDCQEIINSIENHKKQTIELINSTCFPENNQSIAKTIEGYL